MLTYRFFNVIFDFAFVLLMLINLMIGFNSGNFARVPDNSYFGITTLISIFQVDSAPQGTPSAYIGTLINAVNGWINDCGTEIMNNTNNFINEIQKPSNWVNWLNAFAGIGANIFMIVAYVFMMLANLLIYVFFIVSMFSYVLTGGVISTQPSNIWTYPTPQFRVLGATLINYI